MGISNKHVIQERRMTLNELKHVSDVYCINQDQMNQFAEVTGGTGKIHCDPEYAKKTKFGNTLVHGLFLVAMIEKELAEVYEDYDENGRVNVTFIKPVLADQAFRITCEKNEEDGRINVSLLLTNGGVAVNGKATIENN
jgi:acyl dehydratase